MNALRKKQQTFEPRIWMFYHRILIEQIVWQRFQEFQKTILEFNSISRITPNAPYWHRAGKRNALRGGRIVNFHLIPEVAKFKVTCDYGMLFALLEVWMNDSIRRATISPASQWPSSRVQIELLGIPVAIVALQEFA
ncbi:MAG: hypothetical protein P4L50_21155 [Anaerolineaceae bacterium]|nr:hypothetical protein [Anaerolineaceae bacterium]